MYDPQHWKADGELDEVRKLGIGGLLGFGADPSSTEDEDEGHFSCSPARAGYS